MDADAVADGWAGHRPAAGAGAGAGAGPAAAGDTAAGDTAAAAQRARATRLIIALTAVVGLALRLYQLTRPGYLFGVTEYDDGVYLGDAVRVVHGVLPYRGFVSDQPPGIVILMAPVALLSKVAGTAAALAAARVLTSCTECVTIMLIGRLVRHRGPLVTAAACGFFAVYPEAVGAAHTLLLEPWLNLICAAGAVVAFDGDLLSHDRRRLLWAGAAFGFAGAVKVWAIVPTLVLVALCGSRPRRAAAYITGVVAGFLIPVLPFAAASPRSFVNSVIVTQLSRADIARVPRWRRLASMAGISHLPHLTAAATAAVAGAAALWIAGACVAAWITARHRPPALEWFALATAGLVVAMLLWPPQYFPHYASFLGPYLGLAAWLPAARVSVAWYARWARAGLAAAAIGTLTVLQIGAEAKLPPAVTQAAAAQRVIPTGACVLTDMAALTITADRFVTSVAGCPLLVDSTGTDYVLSHGRNGYTGAARVPAVPAMWRTAFAHAQYVWLSWRNGKWIPWTPPLRAYFRGHFQRVATPGAPPRLYVRTGLTAAPRS